MGEIERRFDHNVTLANQRVSYTASVTKLKKSSTQALAEFLARREAPFDLIYIDGSHQAPDVLSDAVLAFQLLRVGGIMIFDDYLWRLEPDGRQDPLNMPKPAIDSFINIFQRKLRVISGLPIWQLYIERMFS
jgi:predicted O-methyltransferase YrrM